MIKGIDVSEWNDVRSFEQVKKARYKFVLLRAGYGSAAKYPEQYDKTFEKYYKSALSAGLSVGAYWYTYAKNEDTARLEAESFINCLKGKSFVYPLFIDCEEPAIAGKLGKAKYSEVVDTFLETLKAAGYNNLGIYASASFFDDFITEALQKKYVVWCAQYYSKCENDFYSIWQHRSDASVPGIVGRVDENYDYKDLANKNKKSVDTMAYEVIAGRWGNGDERKKKLTAAGYDYEAVQKKVNEMYSNRKSDDVIAMEVIHGDWGNGAERKKKLTAAGYDYDAVQN